MAQIGQVVYGPGGQPGVVDVDPAHSVRLGGRTNRDERQTDLGEPVTRSSATGASWRNHTCEVPFRAER